MEKDGFLKNSQIFLLGICIAVGTIAASFILSQGFLKLMKIQKEVISVTGSAQKDIKSDYAVWQGIFSRRGPGLEDAYENLKADLKQVKACLAEQGVTESELLVSQISTKKLYRKNEKGNDTNEIEAYILSQTAEVRSGDADKVARLSRESTELIQKGIEFESQQPEYFYTKLDELKVEMLAKATENARQRALRMAEATGNRIGVMRQARMGVFQITPLNSTEVSDWGINDTTSLEKKVTAVVNVTFAIE